MGSAPSMHGGVIVATVALSVLALLAGAGAAGTPGTSPAGSTAHEAPIAQTDVEADTVSLRVDLTDDGTATWRVTYRIELDDENATAAFEELRADVRSDPGSYTERFAERMARTARAAENATGREMSIGNVTVEAARESLPQGEYGVVTYRLDWQGFAVAEDDRLRAGDAIDRFFLDSRTSLSIAWPDDYRLASVGPDATAVDDGSVTWQGRRDFGPGEPRVELVRGKGGEPPGAGDCVPLALVSVVVALALVSAAVLYARRGGAGDGESAGRGTGGDGETPGTSPNGPPPELLSNEERVLQLLEDRGGRIKQQEVATALEWTDAKTSQVVSDLREAGDLESFRLGRENVLTLPDVSLEPEPDEDGGEQ